MGSQPAGRPGAPLPQMPPGLRRWLLSLSSGHRVIVPAGKAGNRVFEEVDPDTPVAESISQDHTLLPAKKLLIPPEETLFEFSQEEIREPARGAATVVFGLHVCELSAASLLATTLQSGAGDEPFSARNARTLTIGFPCRRSESCFCQLTGHDRIEAGQYDLFVWPEGDSVRLQAGSRAGQELAAAAPFPAEAASGPIRAPQAPGGGRWPLEELPERMRASFGATMWDELAARCLGCGNCTVVCPLCYCFFTQDETGLDPAAGRRLRHWDSCQLVAFARVAGGHNFREERSERIWYRFSHKFMRMQEAFGLPGCSGCGACLHFCPVDISPRSVIEGVLGVKAYQP